MIVLFAHRAWYRCERTEIRYDMCILVVWLLIYLTMYYAVVAPHALASITITDAQLVAVLCGDGTEKTHFSLSDLEIVDLLSVCHEKQVFLYVNTFRLHRMLRCPQHESKHPIALSARKDFSCSSSSRSHLQRGWEADSVSSFSSTGDGRMVGTLLFAIGWFVTIKC